MDCVLSTYFPLELFEPGFRIHTISVTLVEHLPTYLNNKPHHLERSIATAKIPIHGRQHLLRCQSNRMILGQGLLVDLDYQIQQ